MLVGAQVEWLVIKDTTKFGIHQANSKGRWVNTAPIGYLNQRDESKKPILVIDEKRAPVIKKAFEMFVAGVPFNEIRKYFKIHGITQEGNSSMRRTLENPLYCGLVKVQAYYDEPERLQPGIHAPIVTQQLFYQAQALLNGKTRNHVTYNPEVPLRGALRNAEFNLMTAGNSKGKNKYYWYYVDPATRQHYNAAKLHSQFNEILEELSFSSIHINYLQEKALENIKASFADRERLLQAHKQELRKLLLGKESNEEKYITEGLDKETYEKWRDRLQGQIFSVEEEVAELRRPINEVWKAYEDNLHRLNDLQYLFEKASIIQKHSFINVVFDKKLYYEAGAYRTPYLLPLFTAKAASLKEKRLLFYEQPSLEPLPFSLSSRYGSRTRLSSVKGRCPSR